MLQTLWTSTTLTWRLCSDSLHLHPRYDTAVEYKSEPLPDTSTLYRKFNVDDNNIIIKLIQKSAHLAQALQIGISSNNKINNRVHAVWPHVTAHVERVTFPPNLINFVYL